MSEDNAHINRTSTPFFSSFQYAQLQSRAHISVREFRNTHSGFEEDVYLINSLFFQFTFFFRCRSALDIVIFSYRYVLCLHRYKYSAYVQVPNFVNARYYSHIYAKICRSRFRQQIDSNSSTSCLQATC